MFLENVSTKKPLAPVFQTLGKLGSIVGVCPKFDFKTQTLVETQLSKLKSFIIVIFITVINITEIIESGIWGEQYYLNSVIDCSIASTIIMTCEAILSPIIRKNIWLQFFTKYTLMHNNTSYKKSRITCHFFRNIKKYFAIYLSVSVTVMWQGYIIWMINQHITDSFEMRVTLTYLVGDSSGLFVYNSEKFIIASLLHDIKLRYNWLSWKVILLTSIKHSRKHILENIETIEIQALHIYDVVILFKQLFETHLFLMMVFGFCLGLEYCVLNYSLFEVQNTNVYLVMLIPIFICIYSCDVTCRAAENLSANLLAASVSFEEDTELSEKLKDVSYKIRALHNEYTAARFLTLDRRIAISLLSAVGSYFLVIQQAYLPRQ